MRRFQKLHIFLRTMSMVMVYIVYPLSSKRKVESYWHFAEGADQSLFDHRNMTFSNEVVFR